MKQKKNVIKVNREQLETGMKFDNGKLRWDLLDLESLKSEVEVLSRGAVKYAPNNWKLVKDWKSRYFAALMRHLTAWKMGETDDPEWGINHLSHAMCNLRFLQVLEREQTDKERRLADEARDIVNEGEAEGGTTSR